jgi:hypothetical protein
MFFLTCPICPAKVRNTRQENGKVLTRRGQVHVFGQQFLDDRELFRRKMDQSPDFVVLLRHPDR